MTDPTVEHSESHEPSAEPIPAPEFSRLPGKPWVTGVAVAVCIGNFLGLAVMNDYESWETVSRFGSLPATSIWHGAYWALVTSTLVHFELWHLAFNLYWLWVLGSRLERAIGPVAYLTFYIAAAVVSSSCQLAFSDTTGIGASGVVYAIFGFMLTARHRYSEFAAVLGPRTIQLFLVWLVGCIVVSVLGIMDIGNAAHVSGQMFGAFVAAAFALRFHPRLMLTSAGVMLALAITFLFWCPWSVTWLSLKAYDAHLAEQYETALARYSQIIRRDPHNAWAYHSRGLAYQSLGQPEQSQADLNRAYELDPTLEPPQK